MHRSKKIEKPDWFELSRYDSVRDLTFNQWAYQLSLRYDINQDINHRCDYCGELCKTDAARQFEQLKVDPLPPCPENFCIEPHSMFYGEHMIPGLKFIFPVLKSSARYLPNWLPLESERIKYSDPEFEEHTGVFDGQRSDLGNINGTVFLSINLNASNSVLMEEFTRYIDHVREFYGYQEANIKPKSILKRLAENKVLPFLDLWLYSQLVNSKPNEIWSQADDFPYRSYADWLFPDDGDQVGDGDTVRKTIKPLALDAIKLHFIGSIANPPEEKKR